MSSPEIEEIKNRLNITDVVGEYIRLTKAGSNWKALCPFHNEKSPSFMVSEERGSWHCFGCGKGGDVFSFVMEIEGVEFREALERLAQKAGVELKRTANSEQRTANSRSKEVLYNILELATKWYEKNLWEGKGKEKALPYLRERGLTDASIRKFRLGYAPDGWRNMLEFLTKREYAIEDISKTGLLVEKNPGSDTQNTRYKIQDTKYYDRFRDRIMFPIQDLFGRVAGYSARVAPGGDEKNAKYVNTPQTALYDKSRILYGLNFAKVEIKKKNEVILVEGNMDVIATHQHGFENTVAVSGTALTDEQVKILKRYGENIKMGFDMDAAGQTAARRSIRTCLEGELNVKIIQLGSGKDAAESLKEDPEIWKTAVEKAQGIMEYYFSETFSRYDAKDPTGKKKIAQELLNAIKDIANPIEQHHWIKILAEKIGTEEKILFGVLEKTKGVEKRGAEPESGTEKKKTGENIEKNILGIILAFPRECQREIARINPEGFQNSRERDIIGAIKNNQENFGLSHLKALFSDYETGKFLEEAAFEAQVRFGGEAGNGREALDPVSELRGYLHRMKKDRTKKNVTRLIESIKVAEEKGDRESVKNLTKEFQDAMREMAEDG
ncbi:MAG: DNA primase [Candidatus Moranbacteria bacterium]|nr:DNA primase [Candidatus Moranbacteria bacterium]